MTDRNQSTGSDRDPVTGSDRKASSRGFRLSDFSIRHPVSVCTILVSFLVLGTLSVFKIPLVMLPEVDAPFLMVHVPYYNATPQQVEEQITRPLEEVLSTIPNIQRITSNSTSDSAFIQLFFGWGEDADLLRADVREIVELARPDLPQDVEGIYIQNWNTNEIPIMEARIASGRDLRGSYDFLDLKIKKPLESVPGVAEVRIGGVQRKEINIYLRLDDIKRHRVNVDSLFRRLDSANLNVSLGRVEDRGFRYGVLNKGNLASMEEIRQFPVNQKGLRLHDIAEVGFRSPDVHQGRRLNGEYAVSLSLRKTSEANTVRTVERVLRKIEELNRDPSLEGVEVLVWHNSGEEITESLSGLLQAGTVGALLSVLVLFFFLRKIGATLVIGFAIPFSLISAIGCLHLLGKTLNVLSMMGLMLSAGMLVDNAVVVLESIFQRLEKGVSRADAARVGTQEVVTAVLGSTLTSIIIFAPLVFGRETQYSIWLSHSGVAIMAALLCSLFISVTLIPLSVARLIPIGSASGRWRGWLRWRNTSSTAEKSPWELPKRPLVSTYLKLVQWNLRHRLVTGLLVVPALIGSSFFVLSKLPDNSPEAEDLQDLAIRYEFSENYHYAVIAERFVRPVEQFLTEHRERLQIDNIYSDYGNNEASTRLYFDKAGIELEDMQSIRSQIAAELPIIPGAKIELGRQEGAENENWVGVNLYGEDSLTLLNLATEARRRLRDQPDISEVHTERDRGKEEVRLHLDRDLARRYGVSPESMANILNIVLRGRELRGYQTTDGEVEIWVKLQPGDREDLADLMAMTVGSSADGQGITLSQVAGISLGRTPGSIQRENRQPYIGMWLNYSGNRKEEGKAAVASIMDTLIYPRGYGWSFGFWTQRQEKEDRDFYFNLLLALFMVYFVMASLFESLAHPFAIMVSLLFASVGVAWFLLLSRTPFNLMAMIGLMILMGIVVNNGIVLLVHVNHFRRQGWSRSEALLEGCRERFRPILMTATTTVVGLIPLAIGTSGILGLRYFPMARTVMGGLIAATVLTLIVLPVYYTLIDDLARWARRIWVASSPAHPDAGSTAP